MLKQELEKRILHLQREMSNHQLDAYIISSEDNIWYLSNVTYKPEERPFFIIITPREKPVLIVPKLEEKHLHKIIIDCEIRSYWEYPSPPGENWFDILQSALEGHHRVGTESSITMNIANKIDNKELLYIDLVDEMRKVKSKYELEFMRYSAKISEKAMERIFQTAYAGASVVEFFTLSKSVQTELIRNKTFDPITTSLLTAVWPAPVSSMPHSIPNLNDTIRSGPNVAMSYFRINGYSSECERTFFMGEPKSDEKEHFHHMMSARKQALSILKAGVRCSDVDSEAKNYLIKNGYKEQLLHRTGHGVGVKNHEAPFIAEGSEEILQENMIITIEPGIYMDDLGGYRHSDTILITKDGYELLTRFPLDLKDVTITKSNFVSRIKGKVIQKALKF